MKVVILESYVLCGCSQNNILFCYNASEVRAFSRIYGSCCKFVDRSNLGSRGVAFGGESDEFVSFQEYNTHVYTFLRTQRIFGNTALQEITNEQNSIKRFARLSNGRGLNLLNNLRWVTPRLFFFRHHRFK